MSIWAQRTFYGDTDEICDRVQGVFAEIFTAMGSPSNMLLLSQDLGQGLRLVAELPHPVLLHALDGFEPIEPALVPPAGELIVGWEDRFERRFRYHAAPVI